jgi:adenylyl-sulfate kinase
MVRYATSHTGSERDDFMFQGKSLNVTTESTAIPAAAYQQRTGHKGHVVWLTGLVRSGKTTIARELTRRLFDEGRQVFHLDGDALRHGLSGDLGFSEKDRRENVRRAAQVARMLCGTGTIVVCSFISPRREMRDFVRAQLPPESFCEVFVDCGIDICRSRDNSGLYEKAERGEIPNFTGISAEYEIPENPDVRLDTARTPVEACVDTLIAHLSSRI